MQVQGQHPHQWAPFQIAGLLHAWQISHQISRYVYHEGWQPRASTLSNPSLSASQAHAFHQPVCQRLSWLHHWSVPHVHTIEVFSPSEWGPDPRCQAAQVDHWTWWWQCLAAWHCRSVWSLPCHFAADAGGSALSMAKSRWHGALHSAHKSCTHGHVFWKRGGVKRGLVADPWTSSRRFSHVLWLKVHSHLLLRACLLGSKRKLPPQACQVRPGLPSVVCHPCTSIVRVLFQALEPTAFLVHPVLAAIAEDAVATHSSATDSAWELAWTLQEVQSCTADHDLCLSCIYSQSFLLYCFFPSQEPPDTFLKWFSDDNKVIGIEVLPGDPRAELSW